MDRKSALAEYVDDVLAHDDRVRRPKGIVAWLSWEPIGLLGAVIAAMYIAVFGLLFFTFVYSPKWSLPIIILYCAVFAWAWPSWNKCEAIRVSRIRLRSIAADERKLIEFLAKTRAGVEALKAEYETKPNECAPQLAQTRVALANLDSVEDEHAKETQTNIQRIRSAVTGMAVPKHGRTMMENAQRNIFSSHESLRKKAMPDPTGMLTGVALGSMFAADPLSDGGSSSPSGDASCGAACGSAN